MTQKMRPKLNTVSYMEILHSVSKSGIVIMVWPILFQNAMFS